MDARPLASFSTPASPMKFWDRLSSGKIGKVQLWHSSFTSYNCVKNGFFMDTICVIFKGINVSKLTLAISDISKNLKRLIASQLQSLLFGFSQDWKTKKKKIIENVSRKCLNLNHTKSLFFPDSKYSHGTIWYTHSRCWRECREGRTSISLGKTSGPFWTPSLQYRTPPDIINTECIKEWTGNRSRSWWVLAEKDKSEVCLLKF